MAMIKADAVLLSIEAQFKSKINVWPFTHSCLKNIKKHYTPVEIKGGRGRAGLDLG